MEVLPYYSTGRRAPVVSFREAVFAGLAPDGGLYLPVEIPRFSSPAEEMRGGLPFGELAARLARPFVDGDIDDRALRGICNDAFDFPVPLVRVAARVHALELFWGPTFAFKDFGARFLARVMNHFSSRGADRLTILVATSGDTGSAVAHGFLGMPSIDVVLLYPSGRVSPLQEKQLTTLGRNVTALEVKGAFDDCQAMVKAAFADAEVRSHRRLSSANSINVGRLIPQAFYYVHAYGALAASGERPDYICVPSGNFGNLTGAVIARRMGLPVARLVAATNVNDVVPRYLENGDFRPRPAVQTPASAMDVGNPSNFARILEMFGGSRERMGEAIRGIAVPTPDVLAAIARCRREHGYLLDPHGAVGYEAMLRFLAEAKAPDAPCFFAATAHPAKFREAILEATGLEVEVPPALAAALSRDKQSVVIGGRPEHLREYLLDTAT